MTGGAGEVLSPPNLDVPAVIPPRPRKLAPGSLPSARPPLGPSGFDSGKPSGAIFVPPATVDGVVRGVRSRRSSSGAAAGGDRPKHPRVATILGVDKKWHWPLILCRGLSLCPSILGAVKVGFTLLERLERNQRRINCVDLELVLAALWCGVAAFVSFLFSDQLMNRWLIYYTPMATIVRLSTIGFLIAFITSNVVKYIGFDSSRMLLPAWIAVAFGLIVSYHITLRNIKMPREIFPALNLFCAASFFSMCVLLLETHLCGALAV